MAGFYDQPEWLRFEDMYQYQRTHRYFAQIADGMEEMGAAELSELGVKTIQPTFKGIYFEADKGTLYRVNYCATLCSRILAPLLTFDCHSTRYLYKTAKAMDWPALFSPKHSFALSAVVNHSHIKHSKYAALCLKDAIVDAFRERMGSRPNVDRESPDVRLGLHIDKNRAIISFDTSGDSLHRRGYRRRSLEAPMQESLAAAIIRLSEWDGSRPIFDPLCGSGTLLCEALMRCCRLPSGILRKKFGFESLPDYDAAIWKQVKQKADRLIRRPPPEGIAGSDISREAIATSRTNLRGLRFGDSVQLQVSDFQRLTALENTLIVCNPPYGIRQGRELDLDLLFKSLGDFLKQRCKGSTSFIYFGERELIKRIGLKPAWKKPLKNGGLDGRLVKYELY